MSGGPVGQPESARWCRKEADGWPRKPTILVVTEDPEPSEAMSAWLREAGLRVVACPGRNPDIRRGRTGRSAGTSRPRGR
jgi:hypothetical protein